MDFSFSHGSRRFTSHVHSIAQIYAIAGLVAILGLALPTRADAKVLSKTESIGGARLSYKVILPDDYDAAKEYPAILAFPGGGQGMPIVEGMIDGTLRKESEARGYITVIAAAPAQGLFFEGGDVVFPGLLDKILATYKIRGGKFHVMGISNGGISAFHIAAKYPGYFWTVTGLPGYLHNPETRIDTMKGKCVHMYVGENDGGWLRSMQTESRMFTAAGITTTFSIEKGQGHVMRTLQGDGAARLFDHFDAEPTGCPN